MTSQFSGFVLWCKLAWHPAGAHFVSLATWTTNSGCYSVDGDPPLLGWCLRRTATFPAWRSPPADRLNVCLRYLSTLPRTSARNYGLPNVTGNVHCTWAAFLCGYPLLPYFFPTKNVQRHAVLCWYMYSGVPPSCNSCYVCTVMRIPIVVRQNKTR